MRFDAAYYERHYGDEESAVISREAVARLVRFVAGYLDYLDVPVRRVLDAGCGEGFWREPTLAHFPGAKYVGIEYSPVMCAKHGWERASLVDYRGRPADLVVCQGVLQYLSDEDAEAALRNLVRLAKGALYLEALTQWDWDNACDQELSDGEVWLRTGDWYRERLASAFIDAGGGVFVAKRAGVVFYELEARRSATSGLRKK